MAEIVGGFPVVEGLVAVLDRRKQSGYDIRDEEQVEGRDRLDPIRTGFPV